VFGDANALLARHAANGVTFDVCAAIGVLYHMQDPVKTIELVTKVAPVVYVWTHVASEQSPEGEWAEIRDSAGRRYEGRYHYYGRRAHLGGIAARALWLKDASLCAAFENAGHRVEMIERAAHPHGDTALFVARAR
jgi:hypothetical protein